MVDVDPTAMIDVEPKKRSFPSPSRLGTKFQAWMVMERKRLDANIAKKKIADEELRGIFAGDSCDEDVGVIVAMVVPINSKQQRRSRGYRCCCVLAPELPQARRRKIRRATCRGSGLGRVRAGEDALARGRGRMSSRRTTSSPLGRGEGRAALRRGIR